MCVVCVCFVRCISGVGSLVSGVLSQIINSLILFLDLVNFHRPIDLSDEPVTGEEANGTGEEENEYGHNYCITKV